MSRTLAPALIEIARLALMFGRVDRITLHEDGIRPETDTDHTVMLMLCAVTVHASVPRLPAMNLGMVLKFALIHDLVEAVAGDTPAYKLSAEAREAKELREAEALRILGETFEAFRETDWLPGLIAEYEAQVAVEARFIRLLDKMMPKLTHALNLGATLRRRGETPLGLAQEVGRQGNELFARYPEFEVLRDLWMDTSAFAVGGLREGIEAFGPRGAL
jgi:5'-deoxynucleotidase YfbR-like HD superfamily hydrolase